MDLEKYLSLEYFDKDNIAVLDSFGLLKGNSYSINKDSINSYHYSKPLRKIILIKKSGDSILLNIGTNLYETVDTFTHNNYKIYFYRVIGDPQKTILARIEKKDSRIGLNLYIESNDPKRKLIMEDILSIIQF